MSVTYVMRFTVVNTERMTLNYKKVDQLHQMAMLSEIAFQHNTVQRISGDNPYGAWLEIRMGKETFARLYQQIKAADIEIDVEVKRMTA